MAIEKQKVLYCQPFTIIDYFKMLKTPEYRCNNSKNTVSYSNLNSSSNTGSGASLACVRHVFTSFSDTTQYG